MIKIEQQDRKFPIHNFITHVSDMGIDRQAADAQSCGATYDEYDEYASASRLALIQEPMSAEEILEIRFQIYFEQSLLSRLLILL